MKSLLRGSGILGVVLLMSAGVAKADTFLHYSLFEVQTPVGSPSVTHLLGSFVLDANGLVDSSDPLESFTIGKSFTVDTFSGKGIFSADEDVTFQKLNLAVPGDVGGLSFPGYALAGPQLYDDTVVDPTMDLGIFKLTTATVLTNAAGGVYQLRVSQLPEPSSLMLLAAGLAAIAIVGFVGPAKRKA